MFPSVFTVPPQLLDGSKSGRLTRSIIRPSRSSTLPSFHGLQLPREASTHLSMQISFSQYMSVHRTLISANLFLLPGRRGSIGDRCLSEPTDQHVDISSFVSERLRVFPEQPLEISCIDRWCVKVHLFCCMTAHCVEEGSIAACGSHVWPTVSTA